MSRLSAEVVRERVRGTILERIGDTPLIPLHRVGAGLRGDLWAKIESANPGGSVKDRPALWMVLDAEQEGRLRRRRVVLEATSGNTGVALAMVCAVRGYALELCIPDKVSIERKRIVAVQPNDALHGIEGWKHMPTALRPAIWDERVADVHRVMATDDAIAMTKRLAREEGIFTGPSGGAAVAAAIDVAREESGRIVVLIADGGERYLSTALWE